MKKAVCFIIAAVVMLAAFAGCGEKKPEFDPNVKSEGVMTYDQFIAAAEGADVVIEGYIQAKQVYSEQYSNTTMYLADGNGAYFAYRVACTADEYAKFEIGAKVKVTGQKAVWSGEVEVGEGCKAEVVSAGEKYTAPALDITAMMSNTAELQKNMNKAVAIKGAEIVASTVENDATEYAFLYKWNGTGQQGDDIYFNVKIGSETFTFVVESDLTPASDAAYKAIEAAKIGDKLDLGGFLYWYNAPQIQVTSAAAAN
jgi:hypothetical protein